MSLESIYFSSFYRKDKNQNNPTESSEDDTGSSTLSNTVKAETNSIADTVCDDPAVKTTAAGISVSTELSLGVSESHNSIKVPRLVSNNDLKAMQQHSFSSEDDNYNSIDKHFNTGDEVANCQGLKPPKSPWEIAYNKRAEQLAYLQSLQQQLRNEQRRCEGSLQAVGSLPEGLVCQLQQLLDKRQQIIQLTQLLQQQQYFQQHQQQVKFIDQQVSEFLKYQSHQNEPLQTNPILKQPCRPLEQDLLYNLQRQPPTICEASLQQIIKEIVASQKSLSDPHRILSDTRAENSPLHSADPGIRGRNLLDLSAFNKSHLASNSPNVNVLHDFLTNVNYLQKSQQGISFPSSYKAAHAQPAMHRSPFQPILQCKESLFQPIKAPSGNLLHTLADHFEKVVAESQSKQDRLELPKCYPPHTCISNKNLECQYQYPSTSSFIPNPQGQQNQQIYFAQQQNLLDQQIGLLKLLQNPGLEPSLHHITNSVIPRNISKMDVMNNIMDNSQMNEHKFVSNPTNVPLNNPGCILEDQIQALISSISASFKS